METFIAMLRGINVSGQKLINMDDLRSYLRELDFGNVRTYIQSGNIVFNCSRSAPYRLQNLIQAKIWEEYGFEVPVIVKTPDQLEETLGNNPFQKEAEKDAKKVLVTFLAEVPSTSRVEALKALDYSPEKWLLRKADLYLYAPNGYGKAKMNNNFFESKLKVRATTRNWRTVNILVQMARS